MKLHTDHIIAAGHYQPIVTDSNFFGDLEPYHLSKAARGSVDRLLAIGRDMRNRKAGTAIDIGCNIGFFCHVLQSQGFSMTGIDSDEHSRAHGMPSMHETAVELSNIYGLYPTFIKGSYLDHIGIRRADAVLYLSIFHHLFRYAKSHGKPVEEYCSQVLKAVFDMAADTLYLEMSLAFPEVKEAGWTAANIEAKLEEILGAKPIAIHVSPDAHLEPRTVYAIRHK